MINQHLPLEFKMDYFQYLIQVINDLPNFENQIRHPKYIPNHNAHGVPKTIRKFHLLPDEKARTKLQTQKQGPQKALTRPDRGLCPRKIFYVQIGKRSNIYRLVTNLVFRTRKFNFQILDSRKFINFRFEH